MSLVTRDLTVSLGGAPVLRGVSATLGAGELIGVLGPNGAGKSTFVRALIGLLPSAGDVLLDGAPLAALPRADVARAIAYLPQGQDLHWPLSVARLVALGRLPHLGPYSRLTEADRGAVARAMARTEVTHLADRTATALSGGERSRVLLARALAVEAPALVVDEPLANLDPGHQIEGMELLRAEATAGRLVVAVLHDLGLAMRFCDRVLVLAGGALVADGPPAAVLTSDLLAAVYGITAFADPARSLLVPLDRVR